MRVWWFSSINPGQVNIDCKFAEVFASSFCEKGGGEVRLPLLPWTLHSMKSGDHIYHHLIISLYELKVENFFCSFRGRMAACSLLLRDGESYQICPPNSALWTEGTEWVLPSPVYQVTSQQLSQTSCNSIIEQRKIWRSIMDKLVLSFHYINKIYIIRLRCW